MTLPAVVKPWCCKHKLVIAYIAVMSTAAAITGILDATGVL